MGASWWAVAVIALAASPFKDCLPGRFFVAALPGGEYTLR
jgi:hypothetical protein